MNKLALVLVAIACTQGCTTFAPVGPMTPAASQIQLYENNTLPAACEELATIEVAHGNGCGGYGDQGVQEGAINLFRNAVSEKGGNAAVIQSEIPPHSLPFCFQNEFQIRGFAFNCPAGTSD